MWKNGETAGQNGEIDQTDQRLICSEREKEELSGGCALDSGVMEEGSTRLPGVFESKLAFRGLLCLPGMDLPWYSRHIQLWAGRPPPGTK